MSLKIIDMPVSELKPYEHNPRIIPNEAIEKVAESIKTFGFKVPIIVDKDNVIITGHTRLLASKSLGLKTVPVIKAEDLNPEQVKAFRLADNRVNQFSEWNPDELMSEIEGMGDYDMERFGFDDEFLDGFNLDEQTDDSDKDGEGGDEEEGDEDNPYAKNITAPIYQITGENPSIEELADKTKYNELVEHINASALPEDVKEFLRCSATRHIVFNYSKIAEYYAHADKPLQELMEESALVIIDFKKAIQHGFARLAGSLQDIMKDDLGEEDDDKWYPQDEGADDDKA